MSIYKELIVPFLDTQDSENWHVGARELLHLIESNPLSPLTLQLLELFNYKHQRFTDPRLHVSLGGDRVFLDNPVMVGAGWDKYGHAVRALHRLGFSGVEIGTVPEKFQEGTVKTRLLRRQFMIGSGVALNRLGFNSPGMEVVAENLEDYEGSNIPIGVSLGKNKDVPVEQAARAHAVVARRLYKYASYFAINVSSPNTPGLRALQDKGPLTDIAQAVNEGMEAEGGRKPLYVKVSPDLTNEALDDVIQVVLDNGLTGIIATNTTINEDIKRKYGYGGQAGGVSGDDKEYRQMATDKIAHIYKVTQGKIEIIGVGGVNSADTAWEKIAVGASAVQVVTAIRGEGPAVAGRINRGIVARLEREGFSNISEVVVFNSLTSSLTSPIIHLFFRGLVQVHIGGTLHDLQHAERTGETPVATVQSG